MHNRTRVEKALKGEDVDKIPFTVYEKRLRQSQTERELRNKNLCIIDRTVPAFVTHNPDVEIVTVNYTKDQKNYTRTEYHTKKGDFYSLVSHDNNTSWCEKHLFSAKEDYSKLKLWVDNWAYSDNYSNLAKAMVEAGEDVFFRPSIGLEPIQAIIRFMGTERFCYEWMDNRDEIMKLYDSLVAAARRRYKLIANSPALAFNYGGNITTEIISPGIFEQLYVPNYNEAAEILHKNNKFIGSHLDGNCKIIAKAIADSQLDYIEAFTPSPDTDMTLEEACKIWFKKCVWMNFPSSVHLETPELITKKTREILKISANLPRFILSITETVPADRWLNNLKAISQGIESFTNTVEF